MHTHSIYRLILSALLMLPMLTSCVSERMEPDSEPMNQEAPGYLQLRVSTADSPDSRANPTGGEEGDGREHGGRNENTIHDLTLFLYADAGEGLDGAYPVKWSRYVSSADIAEDNPDLPLDRIYNIRIPLQETDFPAFRVSGNQTVRILAVANASDLTSECAASNINEICRRTSYGNADAWADSDDGIPGNADRFVMSSAFNGAKRNDSHKKDGMITATSSSADGTVYSGEVTLERVAARIDLRLTTDNIKEGKIVYTVDKSTTYPEGISHNTLTILNAIPVNLMKDHSYLVKQLADIETTTNLRAAADETTDSRGVPTNYVITPDFPDKPDASRRNEWFGTSSAASLCSSSANSLASLFPLTEDIVGSAFRFEGGAESDRAIILTYANENTHPESLQSTSEDGGETLYPSDYLTGLLFRTQFHPATLYTKGDLSETTDYNDGDYFYLFRTVETEVKESKNLYFSSREARNDYIKTLPAGGKYETADYPGGICYYNIWIRHANIQSDPEENFPMKWGIVRNNIYRVTLNFLGVGQPKPEIREPYAVTSRIYVIKWNFRPQPEIIM